MTHHQNLPKISLEELRVEIKKEYTNVASTRTRAIASIPVENPQTCLD